MNDTNTRDDENAPDEGTPAANQGLPLAVQRALAKLLVAVENYETPKLLPEACDGPCRDPICLAVAHSVLDDYRVRARLEALGKTPGCSACGGPLYPPDYDHCPRCEA